MARAPKRGTAYEGGRPAVVLSVQKSPGTNTLQLTADVDRALDAAEGGLPDGMKLNQFVMRQADFINPLRNVLHVLRVASILVGSVLAIPRFSASQVVLVSKGEFPVETTMRLPDTPATTVLRPAGSKPICVHLLATGS